MILINIKNSSKNTHIDFTDFRPEDRGPPCLSSDLSLTWQALALQSKGNSSGLESTFVPCV